MDYEKLITNKGLLNFLKNISKDKNSIEKFFSCGSLRNMYQYASEISNEEFSFDEFKSALHLLFKHAHEIREISECDEKTIMGGKKTESNIMSLMMMAIPVMNAAMSIYQYSNICKELDEKNNHSKRLEEYYKPDKDAREDMIKKEIALLENKLKDNNK